MFSSCCLQEFVEFSCPESLETGNTETNGQVANTDDVTDRSHEAQTDYATEHETDRSG